MAQKPAPAKPAVVPFSFGAKRTTSPVALSLPEGAAVSTLIDRPQAIDLAGRRTAWFLNGRGRIGKTTFARWLHGAVENQGGSAIVAACDPGNRTLRRFLDGVAEPPTTDPVETRDWLWSLLHAAMTGGHNAIIDLGGGNSSLTSLLEETPSLGDVLSEAGLEPVAIYLLGTDPDDLTVLAMNERLGFRPRATAIILNEIDGRRYKFNEVLEHPTTRKALDNGAVQLWMPALWKEAAETLRRNAWPFKDVAQYADVLTTSAVQTWLRRMDEEFAPIRSWFPA